MGSDGTITVPLIGQIVVRDKTPTELSDLVTEQLKTYLTQPSVTIFVSVASASRLARLLDEAVRLNAEKFAPKAAS